MQREPRNSLGAAPHPPPNPSHMNTTTPRLLLLAHGSRQPEWARPFEAVLAAVRASRPELRVELAYLESMQPSLAQALLEAGAAGCTQLHLVPLFLGAGGHLQRDIPQAVRDAHLRHPQLTVRVAAAAGDSPDIVAALAAYALRCAQG
uniref:Putative Sirohydrochlorin cobaltochelatase CbiX n=1 Tax=mine drainage metagenome TaxID=410659 RepID=E6PMP9_9ZZZZ